MPTNRLSFGREVGLLPAATKRKSICEEGEFGACQPVNNADRTAEAVVFQMGSAAAYRTPAIE